MKHIFVSSTFRDFHFERDVIRNKIMPAINERAATYGDYVNFCDLRWGIDNSAEIEMGQKTGVILSGCLDEIDRSRPYMIVLLGDRYGFIPKDESLKNEALKRNIDLDSYDVSVTQLEIEYGALQSLGMNVFYYFREIVDREKLPECSDYLPENKDSYRKLIKLKNRIMQEYPDRVRTYKVSVFDGFDLSAFSEMVISDLSDELENKEWKKYAEMPIYEKDNLLQLNLLENKASSFKIGYILADKIIQNITDNDSTDKYLIYGESGIGKSTLLSYICVQLQNQGYDIIPFFIGSTEISSSEENILSSLIWQLEKIIGVEHDKIKNDLQSKHDYLNNLCLQLDNKKVVVAVDATNYFTSVDDVRRLRFIPEVKNKNISILITTNSKKIHYNDIKCFSVPPLIDAEKGIVIKNILSENGKNIPEVIIKAIEDKKSSENPLYLYMAINRLCLLYNYDYSIINSKGGNIEHINEYILDIVQNMTQELPVLSREVLDIAAEYIAPEALKKALLYIMVSRRGLRFSDIESLLNKENIFLPQLYFSQCIHFLNELFVQKEGGYYDFFHSSVREGFIAKKEHHLALAEYMLSLPEGDPLRESEVIYHLINSEEYDKLINYVLENVPRIGGTIMEEIYKSISSNNTDWLERLIKERIDINTDPSFLKFLRLYFCNVASRLREYPEAIEFSRKLGEYCKNPFEELLKKYSKQYENGFNCLNEYCEVLDTCRHNCTMLFEILKENGNADDIESIIEYVFKEEQLMHTLCSISSTLYNWDDYADILRSHADFLWDVRSYSESINLIKEVVKIRKFLKDYTPITELNYEYDRNALASLLLKQARVDSPEFEANAKDLIESTESIIRLSQKYEDIDCCQMLHNCIVKLAIFYDDYRYTGKYPDPLPLYEKVLMIEKESYFKKRTDFAMENLIEAYISVGIFLTQSRQNDDLRKAIDYFVKGFSFLEEKLLVCPIPEIMDLVVRLSKHMVKSVVFLGDSETAEKAFRICKIGYECAQTLFERMPMVSNMLVLMSVLDNYCELSLSFRETSRIETVIELCEKNIKIFEESGIQYEDDRLLLQKYGGLLSNLGDCYYVFGSKESTEIAKKKYEKALDILLKGDKEDHDTIKLISVVENYLTSCSVILNSDLDKALEYANDSVNISKRFFEQTNLDKDKVDLAFSYIYLGDILFATGKTSEAITAYQKSATFRKELADSLKSYTALNSLAVAYLRIASVYRQEDDSVDSDILHLLYLDKACEVKVLIAKKTPRTSYLIDAARILFSVARAKKTFLNDVGEYEKRMEQALDFYMQVATDEMTYGDITQYIVFMLNMSEHYISSENIDRAEALFKLSIDKVDDFCIKYDSDYYSTMRIDTRMEIANLQRKHRITGWEKNCINIYLECIEELDRIWKETGDIINLSNLISICYNCGITYLLQDDIKETMQQMKNAVAYADIFLKNSGEMTLSTEMIYYDVFSCLGKCILLQATPESAEESSKLFQKALEIEKNVLERVSDSEESYRILEINHDMRRDIKNLAISVSLLEDYEKSYKLYLELLILIYSECKIQPKEYSDKLLDVVEKLLDAFMKTERTNEKVHEIIHIMYAIIKLSELHPEIEDLVGAAELFKTIFDDIDKAGVKLKVIEKEKNPLVEADEYYSTAEALLSQKNTDEVLELLERFNDIKNKIPKEKWNRDFWVKAYNSYSIMGAIYANKSTTEDIEKAVVSFSNAVELEKEALSLFIDDEILSDSIEDMENKIMLLSGINSKDVRTEYHNLMLLLKKLIPINKEYAFRKIFANITRFVYWLQNNNATSDEIIEAVEQLLHNLNSENVIELGIYENFLEKMFLENDLDTDSEE